MSNFKGEYLRIFTPRTTDGINLKMDNQRRPIFKETHAPLSALKNFQRENVGLKDHLKHIIEHVGSSEPYRPEPPAQPITPTPNNIQQIPAPKKTRAKRGSKQPSNQTI